jgi:hypothetical protein
LEFREWADVIDMQDLYRVLIDPRSQYAVAGGAALARAYDSEVIRAMDADTSAGPDGGTLVTFLSECADDITLGQALTIQVIIDAKRALDLHDVDDDRRHIVLPPSGFDQLLKQTTHGASVTSKDFAKIRALVAGEIDELLGFKWHRYTLLPSPGAGFRYGFVYHEDAIGLSISSDITTEVTERADKSYSTQVKVSASIGAVRVQGEGVVRITIKDAAY